jgi:hypothetical protein
VLFAAKITLEDNKMFQTKDTESVGPQLRTFRHTSFMETENARFFLSCFGGNALHIFLSRFGYFFPAFARHEMAPLRVPLRNSDAGVNSTDLTHLIEKVFSSTF